MQELFTAFGINGKLILIQAINFGVLLFILHRYLYKPVLKMIDERRQSIAAAVKTAEEADASLISAQEAGKDIIGKAAREAEGLVSDARTRAGEKGAELVKAAEERAEALYSDALTRAEEAKRQALAASEREIAKAAMLAAEKILKEKTA